MSSIRIYRKKIKSAKNIAKITKAMQMVAASKMKKAQDVALAGKDYASGLTAMSTLLSKYLDSSIHPLLADNIISKKNLIIFIAPEKGLCGSLITNLSKKLFNVLSEKNLDDIEFICIGKKAIDTVRRMEGNIVSEYLIGSSTPKFEMVPAIARYVEERFTSLQVGSVQIIYPDFVNTMTQLPQILKLLPLKPDSLSAEELVRYSDYYIFEPNIENIVDPFLKMYLEIEIYQILLESFASEQSSRMVSMKNATDNANSLIQGLTIAYNKERQSSITNEILDIGNAQAILVES